MELPAKLIIYLGFESSEFINKYLRKISYKYSIKEVKLNNHYACIFFGEEHCKCNIYPVRPYLCRTFPFWDHFKKHWKELEKECPGVKFEK